MFKVDSQAPRRVVQCLLAYKLTRQTTTDHLKRGCTSTSNSPRDRTPPLQTSKQTKRNTNSYRLQDNRTNEHCSETTAKSDHGGHLSTDPPYRNRFATNMQQNKPRPKTTTKQARQSKTRQTQRKAGKNDRTKPNGVESKTGTTTRTRHAKGKHGRQNGEAPLGWTKAEHNGWANEPTGQ